jgi:hypothetical protein
VLVVFLVIYNHAQVLRHLLERLDIVRYELGRAVVVLEERNNLAPHKSVGATESEEDREEECDNMVYEEMYGGAYSRRAFLVH